MRVFRQAGNRWVRGAAGAALVVGLCSGGTAVALKTRSRVVAVKTDPWSLAVNARQRFEAETPGTHTRAEYVRVMDGFRAIYHGDPQDVHAARAIEQVAELLAEQGRELGDKKSLRDAAGQYEFLARAYPGGGLAAGALGQAFELLGPEAADDVAEARKVKAELVKEYPRSAAARAAKLAVVRPAAGEGEEPMPSRAAHLSEDGAVATMGRPDSPMPHTKAELGGPSTASQDDNEKQAKTNAGVRIAAVGASAIAPHRGPEAETRTVGADASVKAVHEAGPAAAVTGIRHWSTSSYTRVAIDLGDEVQYEAARVEHPDRIFFDLHHAKLGPQLAGKSFAVTDDGFLTRIRAAQYSDDVTRVVLDVHEVTEYSAFLLPNPYRLIIDIHGKQGGASSKQGSLSSNAVTAAALPASEVKPAVATDSSRNLASTSAISSLPPMPVTDGSAGFGLPAKSDAGSAAAVPAPRVVIASKPTAARPVPNTLATRSSATGTEVAAVSDQPGKVEATRRPTSQPISDRAEGQGPRAQKAKMRDIAHVAGAPAAAAEPTADGETSLVRALGLKIGRIVIDAGHGGHDSGTLGDGGIEEKDVVLDVALRLGKLLRDRLGSEIVYTRADDTFVPLETRTAIANKAQADLFISVHANSSVDASARGVEVYYLNFTSDTEAMRVAARENAVSTQSVHALSDLVKEITLKDKVAESKELAADVDASLYAGLAKGNDGLKNRGVKKAPFVVLIGANMPSILAEISFVTNPEDADELRQPEYRERVAESLYRGVARYAAGVNGKDVVKVERAAR